MASLKEKIINIGKNVTLIGGVLASTIFMYNKINADPINALSRNPSAKAEISSTLAFDYGNREGEANATGFLNLDGKYHFNDNWTARAGVQGGYGGVGGTTKKYAPVQGEIDFMGRFGSVRGGLGLGGMFNFFKGYSIMKEEIPKGTLYAGLMGDPIGVAGSYSQSFDAHSEIGGKRYETGEREVRVKGGTSPSVKGITLNADGSYTERTDIGDFIRKAVTWKIIGKGSIDNIGDTGLNLEGSLSYKNLKQTISNSSGTNGQSIDDLFITFTRLMKEESQ